MRPGHLPPLGASLACALTLAACGSSSSDSTVHTGTAARAGASATSRLPSSGDCPSVIARTLGTVAQRIYDAARHGNVVGQAVHRVESSKALADAVSANDAPATSAALRSLLAGQIVKVRVEKDGKLFADVPSKGVAIAPVRGQIKGTDAQFELSTQAARSYLKVAQQVTGAEVVLLAAATGPAVLDSTLTVRKLLPLLRTLPAKGPIKLGGQAYQVYTLPGSLYLLGPFRIVLLVPSTRGASCGASPAKTAAETLGRVGERIYREEAGSPSVHATLRHIEADAGFRHAVTARDRVAIRAAIVRFFGEHIHVVRVRVYAVDRGGAQRFLYDLGGPYVLAPVHGSVHSAGKLVGRFSFAIQDDAGYLRLARLFTGAEVLMRVGSKQVMGSLDPGPRSVPDHGRVEYRGKSYEAYSFTGEAFPSGPLRISLLIPSAH